jgi:hypothetical protein
MVMVLGLLMAVGCSHPEPPKVEAKARLVATKPDAAPVPIATKPVAVALAILPTGRREVFAAMLLTGMELKLLDDVSGPTYGVDGLDVAFVLQGDGDELKSAMASLAGEQVETTRAVVTCAHFTAAATGADFKDIAKPFAEMVKTSASNMRQARSGGKQTPAGFVVNGCHVFASNVGMVVMIGIEPITP